MPQPTNPKIYHIVHVDRLPSIIAEDHLWCDAAIARRSPSGTTIGMNHIKQRRLNELLLKSHSDLYVGDCVPFYFCPRSVMLYVIHRARDQELTYRGGQYPIIHLESDLRQTVDWADINHLRWAFTLSNAGSYHFKDRCDLGQLDEINWEAVQTRSWQEYKEDKQAEFLVEHKFPWQLVSRVGVRSQEICQQVIAAFRDNAHRPYIEIRPDWYY